MRELFYNTSTAKEVKYLKSHEKIVSDYLK